MRLGGVLALLVLCLALREGHSSAERTLLDYKYFRRLSIDLVGRPPSREELAEFEKPEFKVDSWIDQHLIGRDYAERIRRIYMDLLRLEVGPDFQFVPNAMQLRRVQIRGPNGSIWVYYRRGQRRTAVELDGDFCFTSDETGLMVTVHGEPTGTPIPVHQMWLDSRTVVVKPWWLYADYGSANASDRYAKDWATRFPGFTLVPGLQFEPDGKTATTEVRVCREEAQTAESGRVYVSGRVTSSKAARPHYRATQPPSDSNFAKTSKSRSVSCLTTTGFQNSVDCGCGVGLERCMPSTNNNFESFAFVQPTNAPLGIESPFGTSWQPASNWLRMWWSEEAKRLMVRIFESDRDVRELLTAKGTEVNGPLAQFYRFIATMTCCGPAAELGYTTPESLLDPAVIPSALLPQETNSWRSIPDRGPHASGVLTMPIFLAKYGSRRARAHALYNVFLCKSFVAETVQLKPSTEPDLTKRPGCSSCHRTLEPMAAYFSRINEADWTYWPSRFLPVQMPSCLNSKKNAYYCRTLYDESLDGSLRGASGSVEHAEIGPSGIAKQIVESPDFAPCVVQNVMQSFLGRSLTSGDSRWKEELTKAFVQGGYRMRALVRAIVTSRRYRDGNDMRQ